MVDCRRAGYGLLWASAGEVVVCSCCFGCICICLCMLCGCLVGVICEVHRVVVSMEMDARDCGFDSFFLLVFRLTYRLQLLLFGN